MSNEYNDNKASDPNSLTSSIDLMHVKKLFVPCVSAPNLLIQNQLGKH